MTTPYYIQPLSVPNKQNMYINQELIKNSEQFNPSKNNKGNFPLTQPTLDNQHRIGNVIVYTAP